ncbi:SAM hydrolase/SAM-dependent halogenase family protein [Actinomadura geliboluensis]|uniref:SAM-dependent chlorinase/fluorinase n=1 Tax=Actinomadura geliboluensis TaxID=882440 RepID=A0A5S4H644_9ACTN|nr:SAM-dependent chlorinase/fluorinase [Actinomadura geliboluensis]TMR40214.1 SAM-dependent chlorinase/fluorinase [Actinomadura geliboluensis]
MSESRPFVSLATDFGAAYTSICAGVVYTIAPEATVLVLSDEITPFDVREGAMLLRQALPYLPVGVHTGIVDPGVGTPRRPVAVETGRGDVLIGPDNGLLVPAAEVLGGVVRAHALENPAYRLPEVSTSFHGRDIFSPAAAHVANGVAVADLGPAVEPLPLDVPPPVAGDGGLTVPVLYTDRFGSLVLGAEPGDLTAAFGELPPGTPLDVAWTVPAPGSARVAFAETFGAVAPGEPLLWTDSSGWLGLAVNQGSATDALGLKGVRSLTLRPATPRSA